MNAVELTGVDKTFDTSARGAVHALSGIELSLAPGEFVSLIGPSGCGKSTLLRVVADLEQPSSGTVLVGGKSARQARLAAAAAVIGAIVAEISTGTRGGIGRLIIEYAQAATGDPSRMYTAILGAAVLGLVAAWAVGLLDLALRRYQGVR